MADFCFECVQGFNLPGERNDLRHLGDKELHDKGQHPTELCEGCGWIQVDWEGRRVGPIPVKLSQELNAAWKEMSARSNGHLTEIDRLALEIIVGNAIKASGHDPAAFDIEIGIDEVNKGTVDWSYSKRS